MGISQKLASISRLMLYFIIRQIGSSTPGGVPDMDFGGSANGFRYGKLLPSYHATIVERLVHNWCLRCSVRQDCGGENAKGG